MTKTKGNRIVGILLLFIFACYAIFELFMPYSGDDLAHMISMREYFETHPVWRYPFFFVGHWLDTNGRLFDKVNPILFNVLPHYVNALIAAISVPLMMWIVLKHCRFKGQSITGKVFAIAIMVFVFCWWDSMQAYVCIYNYVLATFFPLTVLYIILHFDKISPHWAVKYLLALLALLAGMMHEAIGVPMACGLIAYQIMTRKWRSLDKIRRLLIVSFMLGVAWGFFAPSLWSRLGNNTTPDDPLFMLLLKSDSLALLLLAMIGVGMCVNSWRNKILEAARTPWIIFAVAAIASMCFSAMSGIIGRSGWFAQVFALIAMVQWCNDHNYKINRMVGGILSAVLIAAIVIHLVEVTRWQVKVGKEVDVVARNYATSESGIVCFDATRDNQLPWWTLNKNRGVPDADDLYLLATFSRYYGVNGAPLVLLPSEVANIDFYNVADGDDVRLSNSDIIKIGKISIGNTYQSERENISISIIEKDGIEWVVTPFSLEKCEGVQLNHFTPRIVDPGDRLTPLE